MVTVKTTAPIKKVKTAY